MLLNKGWVVVQVQVQPNKGGISNPIRGAAPICWGMRRWGVVGEGCSPTEKQNELVIKMLLVTSFCRVFESNMTTMIRMIETVIEPYYRAAPTPHCQGWRRSSNEGRCSLKRWKFYTSSSSSSSSPSSSSSSKSLENIKLIWPMPIPQIFIFSGVLH